MKTISIRWRMTVWNTIAFAIVLIAFGILVYGLLSQTHYEQLDRRLLDRYRELAVNDRLQGVASPASELQQFVKKFRSDAEIALLVQNAAGETVARSHEPMLDARIPAPQTIDSQLQFDVVTLADGERVRRLSTVIPASNERYTLMLLAELEHIDEELGLVLNTFLVTIPLTLAIAGTLAYFLAYKSLAPVEHLRQMTDEITAAHLNRRLPIQNPSDELGMLAQTINSMIARLEQSFNEVRRFTADASHELRTPIAVIRSEAELGVDAAHDRETAHNRFTSILEECNRLAAITSQLLMLSREDAGGIRGNAELFQLDSLLLEAVESLRPLANAKRQRFSVTVLDKADIVADPNRLRQVFHNLLDNAIKYSPEDGQVDVTLTCQDSIAIVTVEDKGLGIAPEHIPRIFDRFYRINKGSRPDDGSGLGLSIVQSVVTSIGGKVEVESKVGVGSVFRVTLPSPTIADKTDDTGH